MSENNNYATVGQVGLLSGTAVETSVYNKFVTVNQVKILNDREPLGGSGGSGGVTTVDLPTCPEAISIAPSNNSAVISITYSNTDFVSGVEVRYKTESYPNSPTDGNIFNAIGAVTNIRVPNLVNNTTYYFRVFLYREIDGTKYYQTDPTRSTVSCTPSVVSIAGITPAVLTDDYLIIDSSGEFTLISPTFKTITAYLVGGGCDGTNSGYEYAADDSDSDSSWGGNGGAGGYFRKISLDINDTNNCVASIGNVNSMNTSLKVGENVFSASTGGAQNKGGYGGAGGVDYPGRNAQDGKTGILTPYGYIGSSGGGGGGAAFWGDGGGKGGTGAGNGGAGYRGSSKRGATNGEDATNYGCGGGGGGDYNSSRTICTGGAGKQGCIILVWGESEGA